MRRDHKSHMGSSCMSVLTFFSEFDYFTGKRTPLKQELSLTEASKINLCEKEIRKLESPLFGGRNLTERNAFN